MSDSDIDSIYDYIDYLSRRGQYDIIDGILLNLVDYACHEKLSVDEILTYLTATFPIKSKLKHRGYFISIVEIGLDDKDLLKGLE